jgi:hypothetical protein
LRLPPTRPPPPRLPAPHPRPHPCWQDYALKAEHSDLHEELAALNKAKVQVQREFEAFKELATQTARQNREETARLLEENAALHSRWGGQGRAGRGGQAGAGGRQLGPRG